MLKAIGVRKHSLVLIDKWGEETNVWVTTRTNEHRMSITLNECEIYI